MDISLFISNTMLIERLCGVSAYVLGLIVICNAIYVSKRASVKRCLVLYALYLTVLAFFYVPGDSADLTRLLVHMHDWSYLDFPDLISLMGRKSENRALAIAGIVLSIIGLIIGVVFLAAILSLKVRTGVSVPFNFSSI